MDKNKLEALGIDYNSLYDRVMGNTGLIEKLLKKFVGKKLLEKAIEAKGTNDEENYIMYIHDLKGVSGNLGMTELYMTSMELEKKIRTKQYDGSDELIEKIKLLYYRICDGIESM